MTKNQIIVSSVMIETNPELSLEELCDACGISPEFIKELIDYGILDVNDISLENYRFTPVHLRKIRTIVHLHHDLEVNLPGAAIVIDLMEQMEDMRVKIEMLEKHLHL
jgi:chaperone modulatory protein CbpM